MLSFSRTNTNQPRHVNDRTCMTNINPTQSKPKIRNPERGKDALYRNDSDKDGEESNALRAERPPTAMAVGTLLQAEVATKPDPFGREGTDSVRSFKPCDRNDNHVFSLRYTNETDHHEKRKACVTPSRLSIRERERERASEKRTDFFQFGATPITPGLTISSMVSPGDDILSSKMGKMEGERNAKRQAEERERGTEWDSTISIPMKRA